MTASSIDFIDFFWGEIATEPLGKGEEEVSHLLLDLLLTETFVSELLLE